MFLLFSWLCRKMLVLSYCSLLSSFSMELLWGEVENRICGYHPTNHYHKNFNPALQKQLPGGEVNVDCAYHAALVSTGPDGDWGRAFGPPKNFSGPFAVAEPPSQPWRNKHHARNGKTLYDKGVRRIPPGHPPQEFCYRSNKDPTCPQKYSAADQPSNKDTINSNSKMDLPLFHFPLSAKAIPLPAHMARRGQISQSVSFTAFGDRGPTNPQWCIPRLSFRHLPGKPRR